MNRLEKIAAIALISIFVSSCLSLPAKSSDSIRGLFRHWSDLDNDQLDTRQEELISHSIQIEDGKHLVVILDNKASSGIWVCPYSGTVIKDPKQLDLDHIVPIKFAYDHGAYNWSDSERELFANDPENLIPVLAVLNRAKGAKGPEEWLPPNIYYIPEYIKQFSYICQKYKLQCDIGGFNVLSKQFLNFKNGVTDGYCNSKFGFHTTNCTSN